jgi:DDE superfamily endonuclease
MRTLPAQMLHLLNPFVPLFSRRVWPHVQVLLAGAVLTPGKRTVSAALRVMGLGQTEHFQRYHRVLNRAIWSGREASRVLLEVLVRTLVPNGPLVIGVDETLERRWGKKIAAKGIYRDPVRSTHDRFIKASGLRWVCLMLLVPVPWAGRVWALPFLSVLAPSERYAAQRGKRHKKITDWARQMLLLVRRWWPEREIVAVADAGYASLRLLASCRRFLPKPVTFITRLRLDAALYDPAPPRRAGQMGRPRLKGERLPNLAVVAEDPSTSWTPTTVDDWYGGGERTVEVASATAVWYSTGLPAVPIRWVLVRDPQGAFATQALLLTDLGGRPEQILGWFVLRWQMDGDDFSASTAASRGRDAKAVVRAGNPADHPGVVGTVLARNPLCPPANLRQVCRASGGQRGIANPVRPSQMLWRWYARSYGHTRLFGARPESRTC